MADNAPPVQETVPSVAEKDTSDATVVKDIDEEAVVAGVDGLPPNGIEESEADIGKHGSDTPEVTAERDDQDPDMMNEQPESEQHATPDIVLEEKDSGNGGPVSTEEETGDKELESPETAEQLGQDNEGDSLTLNLGEIQEPGCDQQKADCGKETESDFLAEDTLDDNQSGKPEESISPKLLSDADPILSEENTLQSTDSEIVVPESTETEEKLGLADQIDGNIEQEESPMDVDQPESEQNMDVADIIKNIDELSGPVNVLPLPSSNVDEAMETDQPEEPLQTESASSEEKTQPDESLQTESSTSIDLTSLSEQQGREKLDSDVSPQSTARDNEVAEGLDEVDAKQDQDKELDVPGKPDSKEEAEKQESTEDTEKQDNDEGKTEKSDEYELTENKDYTEDSYQEHSSSNKKETEKNVVVVDSDTNTGQAVSEPVVVEPSDTDLKETNEEEETSEKGEVSEKEADVEIVEKEKSDKGESNEQEEKENSDKGESNEPEESSDKEMGGLMITSVVGGSDASELAKTVDITSETEKEGEPIKDASVEAPESQNKVDDVVETKKEVIEPPSETLLPSEKKSTATTSNGSTSEKPSKTQLQCIVCKKGRGRPRKYPVDATPVKETASNKRGRPRKYSENQSIETKSVKDTLRKRGSSSSDQLFEPPKHLQHPADGAIRRSGRERKLTERVAEYLGGVSCTLSQTYLMQYIFHQTYLVLVAL